MRVYYDFVVQKDSIGSALPAYRPCTKDIYISMCKRILTHLKVMIPDLTVRAIADYGFLRCVTIFALEKSVEIPLFYSMRGTKHKMHKLYICQFNTNGVSIYFVRYQFNLLFQY